MTINRVAYIQASSLDDLTGFLIGSSIDYNVHRDNCDEEEVWVELDTEEGFISKQLDGEFLNKEEFKQIVKQKVHYIIFY